MKKLSVIMLAVTLLISMGFAGSQTHDAWKVLKKMKTLGVIKTYRTKIEKVKKRYERSTVVELAPIRKALEKAGINETVSIEVRYRSKLIARLGTYEPVTKVNGGKTVVSFASIPVGVKIYRDLTRIESDFRGDVERKEARDSYRPNFLQLVFKDAKGKIKVRLKASFIYIKT